MKLFVWYVVSSSITCSLWMWCFKLTNILWHFQECLLAVLQNEKPSFGGTKPVKKVCCKITKFCLHRWNIQCCLYKKLDARKKRILSEQKLLSWVYICESLNRLTSSKIIWDHIRRFKLLSFLLVVIFISLLTLQTLWRT